jgi:hypothetical protein
VSKNGRWERCRWRKTKLPASAGAMDVWWGGLLPVPFDDHTQDPRLAELDIVRRQLAAANLVVATLTPQKGTASYHRVTLLSTRNPKPETRNANP